MNAERFIKEAEEKIRSIVSDKKVISLVSGGIDSTIACLLVMRAIGKNKVYPIMINSGFLRYGEVSKTVESLKKLGIKVKVMNEASNFFKKIKGIKDPSAKVKAFSKIFYSILFRISREHKTNFIVQGTMKYDFPKKIKKNRLIFIEPLKQLDKEEIYKIGKFLKIPKEILNRKQFPGPGLAVRIIGKVNKEKVRIIRKATKIVEDFFKDDKIHVFPVLLEKKFPIIKKGHLHFGYGVIVRIVKLEGKFGEVVDVNSFRLKELDRKIRKRIPQISHVFLSLTPKPPSTLELQPAAFLWTR